MTCIENCNKWHSHNLNIIRLISPIQTLRQHYVQMRKKTTLFSRLMNVYCVNVFIVTRNGNACWNGGVYGKKKLRGRAFCDRGRFLELGR